MKNISQIILLILIMVSCNQDLEEKTKSVKRKSFSKEVIDPEINDTIIIGDINGDCMNDTAIIYTPPTLTTLNSNGEVQFTMGCIDNNCYNRIKFSCKLPDIIIPNSIWGKVEKIDDLNNDGINEILFCTNWFTTGKSTLILYSFIGGKWKAIEKVSIRDAEDKPLRSYFIKTKYGNFMKGIEQINGDEREVLKRIEE